MNRIDGRAVSSRLELDADVVIVGSGPAGSAVAREVARAGASVVVVEAGPWVDAGDYPRSALGAMSRMYRSMGASLVVGAAPMPFLQGRMVGGSSPINGAICWRVPRDVYDAWCVVEPSLADALPWEALDATTNEIEARLGVAPTDAAVAGPKNLLMARGAEALGLAHRPIRRNAPGCEGLGRCLQGCPKGHKRSADVSLLADALADGATVISSCEVEAVVTEGGRAVAIVASSAGGGRVRARARRAVVVAASAVQTPALLLRSGLRQGPVGAGFSCHPGVSLAGRFPDPVRMWEGATQGHEVTGLRREGLKFEALGFGPGVLAGRLDGVGPSLARGIDDLAHWLDWGVAVHAEARGRVRLVARRPVVFFQPTSRDVALFRRGLRVLGEMMLAAGATELSLGVRGFDPRAHDVCTLDRLEREGPRPAGAYRAAITHMFGTCRMGRDPRTSVVRPDFRHHRIDQLYVADSSVFPSNIGVNPQVPIMAVAAMCGRSIVARRARSRPMRSPVVHTAAPLVLDDLMQLDGDALHRILERGHPLDPDALAGQAYLGVDLSLPPVLSRLLWKTFRKTFHRDPITGVLRGWNVRMEQTGVDGARVPKTDGNGRAITFGHYHVRTADGVRFPRGYRGPSVLDYRTAGNAPLDVARFGYTPLVAVNEDSMDLLIGWEVFRFGPAFLPLPFYYALRRDGPLTTVVPPPRPRSGVGPRPN